MVDIAIKASIAYVRASEVAGTPGEAMDTVKEHQVANLRAMIAKMPICVSDATQAINVITDSPFSADHRMELMNAVHAKAQGGCVLSDVRVAAKATQQHLFIFNYLTEPCWVKQADRSASELDRTIDMVTLCHQIGLFFPDVLTMKTIVATMTLARDSSPTAAGCKALFDLLNMQNKQRRPLKKHAAVTASVFPESVLEFIALNATAYGDDKPVASRVSAKEVALLAPTLAARKTHNLLKPSPFAVRPSMQLDAAPSNANHLAMMAQMQDWFRGFSCRSQPTSPATSLHRSGSLLALTDGSVDGAETQVVDHRTPPAKLRRLGAHIWDDTIPSDAAHAAPAGAAAASEAADASEGAAASEAATVPTEGAAFDLDDVLDASLSAEKEKKAKAKAKKAPTEKKAPAAKKAKAKAKAAAKVLKPSVLKTPEPPVWTHGPPPKFGTELPCEYNGCKIYKGADKFRVMPKPGKSKYDKSFAFKPTEAAAWRKVIEFCKKPTIPSDSVNFAG